MEKAKKAQQIDSLSQKFAKAKALFLVDFKGMTVEQTFKLRKQLHGQNATMTVVRNTLAKRALMNHKDTEAALKEDLVGTNAFIFVADDACGPAKALSDFAKDVEHLQIKTGYMGGKRLDEATIKKLASLPPLPVLRAQFLGMLAAPMSGFVRLLAAKKDQQEPQT